MRLKKLGLGFLIYFVLLTVLYHYKIKHYFYWNRIADLQDAYFDFSVSRLLLASLLFFLNLYFLLQLNKQRLVFIVLGIFFLLLTIPSLIAFTSANMYPAKLLGYHQLFFYSLWFFCKIKIDFSRIPVLNKKQAMHLFFLIISLGILPYLIVYGPHINFKNLVLVDVYGTRNSMAELTNPYFGYTYSIYSKILIPLFIVFAMELRNKVYVILGVVYLTLFYLFGAHKTVYVALIVVFIFYRLSYVSAVRKLVTLSNVLLIIALILAVIGFDYLWILTFRRVHFIPALLDITYLDFFTEQPLYWSESFLGSFIKYPFEVNHAYVIGEYYFNNSSMAANNGLISDGFMNFGTYGVLLNIFLVAAYFLILNSLKIPAKYFGLFILIIFSFLSSATLTVFLTHGALALLFISIFVLHEKKD